MKTMHTPSFLRFCCACVTLILCLGMNASAFGQAMATGVIEGRVLNATSGSYLNNAVVAVKGTSFRCFTGETGEFRLEGVPAGEAQLVVSFTGLSEVALPVAVPAGGVVTKDVALGRGPTQDVDSVVSLDAFVVTSQREENAAAIAAHEQRVAPNIKNVVAADAFGDVAEGSLGEFVKYIPGVVVNYSGSIATAISIRGLPSSTTPILVDGGRFASANNSSTTRDVEIGGLNMNNIARVEVSKTPTPDTPADSMGGSVNVVSKSAFDRRKPLFSYRLYGNLNSNPITLKKLPGNMPENTVARVQPGFDFSYIAPFSRTFGITVNGLFLRRYSGTQQEVGQWRPGTSGTAFTTADKPYMDTYDLTENPTFWERKSIGLTADWKINPRGVLTVGARVTTLDFYQGIWEWRTSLIGTTNAAPLGFDSSYAQSANGAGSAVHTTNFRLKDDDSTHINVQYRHNGYNWKADVGGYFSHSANAYKDTDRGYFCSALVRVRNLNLRYSDINVGRTGPGSITATAKDGTPLDLYSNDPYMLQSGSSSQRHSTDAFLGAHLNVQKDFQTKFPLSVRSGVDVRRQNRDIRVDYPTYNFVGPDGVANTADDMVNRYDVLDEGFSKALPPFGLPMFQHVSPYKFWDLYKAHPEYFTVDQVALINSNTAGSKKLTETVSAGYLRGDIRLFDGRLFIVGGARYERTEDEGYGRLSDIRATYVQDSEGNLVLGTNGKPIKVTTDKVALARLQYKERGAHLARKYGDLYPSANATFTVTENLQARLAYARTIGRPNLSEIIPSISVTDPASTTADRTITVVNTGLKPWTANNYDLSLEYYFKNAGRASIGGYYKEIKGFFGSVRTPATPEFLEEWGLSDDYLGYDIITKNNVGDANVWGIEFDLQQPLNEVGRWARGLIVFVNGTKTFLNGSNATTDFSGFTRESLNWGVSLNRPRYTAKLTWNYRGLQRLDANTGTNMPEDMYNYNAPFLTLNASLELVLSRNLGLFLSGRNIFNASQDELRYSGVTPDYARRAKTQNLGAQFSVGIKGTF